MHVHATVVNIDTAPEFGDITGTEATITVTYPSPWANGPAVVRTLDVTQAEAAMYRVGQVIPLTAAH